MGCFRVGGALGLRAVLRSGGALGLGVFWGQRVFEAREGVIWGWGRCFRAGGV